MFIAHLVVGGISGIVVGSMIYSWGYPLWLAILGYGISGACVAVLSALICFLLSELTETQMSRFGQGRNRARRTQLSRHSRPQRKRSTTRMTAAGMSEGSNPLGFIDAPDSIIAKPSPPMIAAPASELSVEKEEIIRIRPISTQAKPNTIRRSLVIRPAPAVSPRRSSCGKT